MYDEGPRRWIGGKFPNCSHSSIIEHFIHLPVQVLLLYIYIVMRYIVYERYNDSKMELEKDVYRLYRDYTRDHDSSSLHSMANARLLNGYLLTRTETFTNR